MMTHPTVAACRGHCWLAPALVVSLSLAPLSAVQASAMFDAAASGTLTLTSNPSGIPISIASSLFDTSDSFSGLDAAADSSGFADPEVPFGASAVPMNIGESLGLGVILSGAAASSPSDMLAEGLASGYATGLVMLDNSQGIGLADYAFSLAYDWAIDVVVGVPTAGTEESARVDAEYRVDFFDGSFNPIASDVLLDELFATGTPNTSARVDTLTTYSGSVDAGQRLQIALTIQLGDGTARSETTQVPAPTPLLLLGLGLPWLLRRRRLG
jgi:MYXO-CTERM domain-containing protein